MSLSSLQRALLLVPLLGGTLSAAHAHAQQDLRVGNFRVMIYTTPATGRDLGFASVKPDGRVNQGDLVWACGGDSVGLGVGIQLDTSPGRWGAARQAIFRFDQDEPDTVLFLGKANALWVLHDRDTAPATARALTAERLVVRVAGERPSQPAAEYAYRLAGLDSALSRLGCAARAAEDSARAGIVTLQTLEAVRQRPGSASATELIVGEAPLLRNRSEVARQLTRSYPPHLRERGVAGRVVLRVRVQVAGTADTTSIQVDSSTHPGFVAAAVQVVKVARWHPARLNGRPVEVWVTMPLSFIPPPRQAPGQPRQR